MQEVEVQQLRGDNEASVYRYEGNAPDECQGNKMSDMHISDNETEGGGLNETWLQEQPSIAALENR